MVFTGGKDFVEAVAGASLSEELEKILRAGGKSSRFPKLKPESGCFI